MAMASTSEVFRDFDFTPVPEILTKIFEYLPQCDLVSAIGVCELWNEFGLKVKGKKNSPLTFLSHPYPAERTKEVIQLCNTRTSRIPDETWAWADAEEAAGRAPWQIKKDEIIGNVMIPNMLGGIELDYLEPLQIIAFGNDTFSFHLKQLPFSSTFRSSGYDTDEEEKGNIIKSDWFGEMMKVAPCIGATHKGLTFNLPDNSVMDFEFEEVTDWKLPLVSGIVIPKLPGLSVKMFHFESMKSYEPKPMTKEYCMELLNINQDDQVKGIILFESTKKNQLSYGVGVVQKYLNFIKDEARVAFVAGQVHTTLSSQSPNKRPLVSGLVICGDERTRVGSTFITGDISSDENMRRMLKFQDAGLTALLGKRSGDVTFALKFASEFSGYDKYTELDEEHLESTFFKLLFKRTPLAGLFCRKVYSNLAISGPVGAGGSSGSAEIESLSTPAPVTAFLYFSYKVGK